MTDREPIIPKPGHVERWLFTDEEPRDCVHFDAKDDSSEPAYFEASVGSNMGESRWYVVLGTNAGQDFDRHVQTMLTPAQARELAAALLGLADRAEVPKP